MMHRMPADRRLSTLVARGAPFDAALRALAHQLATFDARADRSPRIDEEGGAERLCARWADSFRQVAPFHGRVLDPDQAADIERLTLRFLGGRGPLFAARVERGCVVDGHGDLIAEDVFCLADGPRVLDCLEFDDRLRYLDRVDDAAFLAMDLERLGAPAQSARFAVTSSWPRTGRRRRWCTTTSPTGPSCAPRWPASGSLRASTMRQTRLGPWRG